MSYPSPDEPDRTRYDYQVPVVPSSPPASPAPYGQPYPQPPMYQPAVQQHVIVANTVPTSGWATASLVFGILGIFGGFCLFGIPCIVAVICGHAGLIDTKHGAKGGRGLATAGLILGYLFVGPALAVVAMGGLGAVSDVVTPATTPTP